jgi:hypothetical protein
LAFWVASFFVLLVFAVRDVLFLQWCVVKGFHSPVVKGLVFLFLYYLTALTIAIFFLRSSLAWFTPVGAFGNPELDTLPSVVAGVLLQVAASIFLLVAIRRRLASPAATSAATHPPRTSFAFQDHLWTVKSFGWSLATSTDALEKESQKRHAPSRSSGQPYECANEGEATISR